MVFNPIPKAICSAGQEDKEINQYHFLRVDQTRNQVRAAMTGIITYKAPQSPAGLKMNNRTRQRMKAPTTIKMPGLKCFFIPLN